ncbi:MAG: hypothetical protein EXS36_00620 [Pedosphaera sp.]|nr:hypothetical protein [Pedosphaera sp.]
MNAIAGVGLLAVGVLGNPLLGTIQDNSLHQRVVAKNPALHARIAEPVHSKYGMTYQALDKGKIAILPQAETLEIEGIRAENNQSTLAKVALLPAIMFLYYVGIILRFRSRGGYRPVELA